jgi:hypothetical protein
MARIRSSPHRATVDGKGAAMASRRGGRSSRASKGGESRRTLRLMGLEPGEEAPEVAVYALDRASNPIYIAKADAEGGFDLPDDVLGKAHMVAFGPVAERFEDLSSESLVMYRSEHLAQVFKDRGLVEIGKAGWYHWFTVTQCVNGSVSHCYPYFWFLHSLVLESATQLLFESPGKEVLSRSIDPGVAGDLRIATPLKERLFYRCDTVCDGLVEVYRRTCCCPPIVIEDPRIDDIIRWLEEQIADRPVIKWPPPPPPNGDPPPWSEFFLKSGTIDQGALNAPRDLMMLRTLSSQDRVAYLQARPYLWCSCGAPTMVAQGSIRPDGTFDICWEEPIRFFLLNCYDQYAYKVKQSINGSTVTIYDGVAANAWFAPGDSADLVSYHSQAFSCRNNDFPGTGAFCLLQDIGDTGSFNLKTPDATGWDRVAAPTYNGGLVFPAPSPGAALGQMLDVNWGGSLQLRYHFSEPMKGIGATYYRISFVASDTSGNPTGPRHYLTDPLSWKKYVIVYPDILVDSQVLGPVTVGGESNLFTIPYDADADWQSGQYHGVLGSTGFPEGRYLLTVELFDGAGQKLKPNGAPAGDPGTAAAFTFRRWYQEIGPTADVPFGALTHMLWWDNRAASATIVDLRMDGLASSQQCQFLEGTGSSQFSSGYRAYHMEAMFQLYHSMWWKRGLGGPTGYLTSPPYNPNNVGKPPAMPGVSATETFANMLGSEPKCSFALNLYVWVKTFDGEIRLSGLDASDQAAFALSQ